MLFYIKNTHLFHNTHIIKILQKTQTNTTVSKCRFSTLTYAFFTQNNHPKSQMLKICRTT